MQMQLDTLLAPGAKFYIDQYDQIRDQLPGSDIDWLASQRANSLARFGKIGFPSLKDEDWKYTSVKPIISKNFVVDSEAVKDSQVEDISEYLIEGMQSRKLVFIDGVFDSALSDMQSLESGLEIETFASSKNPGTISKLGADSVLGSVVDSNGHGFTALNNALYKDGVIIKISGSTNVELPIEIVHISCSELSISQPRNLVVLDAGCQLQIIERSVSKGSNKTLLNSATEVILGEAAQLDYYLIQNQSSTAYQVSGMWVNQSAGSRFSCRTITLGGGIVRNDLRANLIGAEAHCDMLGVYSLAGKQHVDNHTTMVHGAENCSSRELYKGVLNQRSRAVFHGRIKVAEGAQKTDATQSNNTLLLSRDAEIDTKPQLEIYADDVKCAHGATIGQIDEQSLFYLRSRGIDLEDAKSLLTYAFVSEVLGEVDNEPLRAYLEEIIGQQLIHEDE